MIIVAVMRLIAAKSLKNDMAAMSCRHTLVFPDINLKEEIALNSCYCGPQGMAESEI